MPSQRIVVVEDDPLTLKVLVHVLTDEGYTVDSAHTGAEALAKIAGRETTLALLDVQLPDISGFTLIGQLRAQHYDGPVIFLTGQSGLDAKLEGFRQGTDDYITKPFEPLELLARVASVIRRYMVEDRQSLGTLIHVDDAELDLGSLTYRSAAVAPTLLAPTEMRVLECLMRSPFITISRDTLIERVWGFDFYGDTNRVDVYIRRVRHRIERDPAQPQYLHTVRGVGYVFRPNPPGDNSAPAADLLDNPDETSDDEPQQSPP
jgi:two-component system, OmpR family, response regulator RegX3